MEQPVDMLLEKGIDFSISVKKINLLHRFKIIRSKREFVIYPICLGALLKMSKLLLAMKAGDTLSEGASDQDFINAGIEGIIANKDRMIDVVAIAILNNDKEPTNSFKRFLNKNLTPSEALQLLKVVIKQMDIQSFLAFMVSVGGINLLASPTGGQSSEESSNTSGSQENIPSGE